MPAGIEEKAFGKEWAEEAEESGAEKSRAVESLETAKKVLVAEYGEVKIYKIAGLALLYYFIPVARPTAAERTIIKTIKEVATRLITTSPYKIRDPVQRRNVYSQEIMEILKANPELNIPQHRFSFYTEAVVREMVGYGLIDPLINDDKLEEIMVIGPNQPVFVFHREYEMMVTNIEFFSDGEIQDLVNRIARQIGRRVDLSQPLLDARLPDGSRVNATMPPASVDGSTLTIRKFREDPFSVVDLILNNTIDSSVAAFLWLAVEGLGVKPANILIAGGTGSGKTTLLNVLASFVPPTERVITIEDTAELSLPLIHWIRLEARPPGIEGTGELTMDILTKNSLRMRPDRIIVGEIRHAEAFTLFTAMNTGHKGSMGTVHANSAEETIVRLTNPPMNVPEVMLSGLDFVIVENRLHDRKKGTIRRLTEVAELSGVIEKKTKTAQMFDWDATEDSYRRTNVQSRYLVELQKFGGITAKQVENELNEREEFLKGLAKKGIRKLEDVVRECSSYLAGKKNV